MLFYVYDFVLLFSLVAPADAATHDAGQCPFRRRSDVIRQTCWSVMEAIPHVTLIRFYNGCDSITAA